MFNLGLLCPDSTPNFLGLFDLSVAPSLLFYAYIPIIILSLLFGTYVLLKDNRSLRSKLLFYLSLTFVLLLFNEIVQWIGSPVSVVLFGWQIVPLFRILVPVFTILFVYIFIGKEKIPFSVKSFLVVSILTVMVLLPTSLNIKSFDLQNCEGIPGPLWSLVHLFEIFSIFLLLFFSIKSFIKSDKGSQERRIILSLAISTILFLLIFYAATIWGDVTKIYDVALVGPIGMVIFLGFLTFMIVKYRAFNIKLIGAQALVVSIFFFIASQFAFIQNDINRILTAITLMLITVFGWSLVISVKKEIEQREELAKSAIALKESHGREMEKAKSEAKLKDEFVYVATHELRTPITAIRGFLELVSEVEAGFSADVKDSLGSIKKASDHLNSLVNNLLQIAQSDAGAMKTETRSVDAIPVIDGILNEVGSLIKEKELVLKTNYFGKIANIIADEQKLKEVMINLISNAIKYNRKGGELEIVVFPESEGNIMIEVRDTGFGIPEEQQSKIFGKFVRATSKDTQGIIGSGLGLFITKMLVEKMGGQISFSSVSGKGTTFAISFKKA